jgi:hypothetical protein
MPKAPTAIAYSCLAILVALYVVGGVSSGSLRHEVQTLPLWFPIVWGFRQRELAKWSALPCFVFWLAIMFFIWLFLLGWSRIVTGHYSAVEVAMTLVIGFATLFGIALTLRWKTSVSWLKAWSTVTLFAALQVFSVQNYFGPIHRHPLTVETHCNAVRLACSASPFPQLRPTV